MDPPSCKMDTFFLMSLALNLPIHIYRRFANRRVSRLEARLKYKRGQQPEKINRSLVRIQAWFYVKVLYNWVYFINNNLMSMFHSIIIKKSIYNDLAS